MTPVLIIGRFQPLCLNHVDLFNQAKELGDCLLIGVGQPNYELAQIKLSEKDFKKYSLSYIFEYEKVKNWIDEVLIDYSHIVKPVKDIFNKNKYEAHIESIFEINKAVLLGENEYTYSCFSQEKYEILIGTCNLNFHASNARQEILNQGFSDKLAVKLTNEDLEKIIKAENFRNVL